MAQALRLRMGAPDSLGRDDHRRGRRRRDCRSVVAAHQRADRTRHGHALAEGGDREEFRRQTDSRRSAAPRSSATRTAAPRLRLRDIVVRDADGTVVATAPKAEVGISGLGLLTGNVRARKPQSGRRRNVGADRDRRPRHRVRRRQQAADRHRIREIACSAAWPAGRDGTAGAAARRLAGRRRHSRLDRRPRRDRSRRPRSARARPQERQSDRRRPAQRQALDLQPDQRQPDAAGAGRRDFPPGVRRARRGPGCSAPRCGRSATACARSASRRAMSRPSDILLALAPQRRRSRRRLAAVGERARGDLVRRHAAAGCRARCSRMPAPSPITAPTMSQ